MGELPGCSAKHHSTSHSTIPPHHPGPDDAALLTTIFTQAYSYNPVLHQPPLTCTTRQSVLTSINTITLAEFPTTMVSPTSCDDCSCTGAALVRFRWEMYNNHHQIIPQHSLCTLKVATDPCWQRSSHTHQPGPAPNAARQAGHIPTL